jgi:hypothetical protein
MDEYMAEDWEIQKIKIDEAHKYMRMQGEDILHRAITDFLNLKSDGYLIQMHPGFKDVIYNVYKKDITRMDTRFIWQK